LGNPCRLCGSLLSACRLSSNGHRRDTTDKLVVTRIQSRWEAREGTCGGGVEERGGGRHRLGIQTGRWGPAW
jgi:hypothetical protein